MRARVSRIYLVEDKCHPSSARRTHAIAGTIQRVNDLGIGQTCLTQCKLNERNITKHCAFCIGIDGWLCALQISDSMTQSIITDRCASRARALQTEEHIR